MQTQLILSDADWAWLAGLFEGEGTIAFNYKACVAVVVRMTDKDVIESIDRLVPSFSGIKLYPRSNPRHKDQWVWSLTARDDVRAFLEGILPWLHARRGARATEALERLKLNHGTRRHSAHCQNGHLIADVGVYVAPTGKKSCRACVREARARYKAKHREEYLAMHAAANRKYRKQRREARAIIGSAK